MCPIQVVFFSCCLPSLISEEASRRDMLLRVVSRLLLLFSWGGLLFVMRRPVSSGLFFLS